MAGGIRFNSLPLGEIINILINTSVVAAGWFIIEDLILVPNPASPFNLIIPCSSLQGNLWFPLHLVGAG